MNARERLKTWIAQHTDQRRFAQDILITESYLSQVLSGRRTPRLPILARIERETGIPIAGWVPIPVGASAKPKRSGRKTANIGAGKSHAAIG